MERVQFLTNKLCRPDLSEGARRHATMERSALMWALEEIDRLTAIEDVLDDEALPEGVALQQIESICEERYRPTDADIDRTPQLARDWARVGEHE